MAAIDLFSGIGGWSLGFQMANIPIIGSYEWWKEANKTHNRNFNTNHREVNIRELRLDELPNPALIDFVVGSPPCTQFSFSNRGGKGDIADGLVDIRKFLEIVEHLNPRYWAMENVPRVAKILAKELEKGGSLARFKYLFSNIKVYNSSDFGVPQDRKRMIAGNFPFELMENYKSVIPKKTLGEVVNALGQDELIDPVYGLKLARQELTDHNLEAPLSFEEAWINRQSKAHHPVYNNMSFPDRLDRPSRTITALCTRVSRESVIIRDPLTNNLRRLTVRERGSLQSFPINYQFHASSYASKIKTIGNAVPPLLTFYIAQAMLEVPENSLPLPHQLGSRIVLNGPQAENVFPDQEGTKYPWDRSFWFAIEGLRFGSGVRFELKNYHEKQTHITTWKVNFFLWPFKKYQSQSSR